VHVVEAFGPLAIEHALLVGHVLFVTIERLLELAGVLLVKRDDNCRRP